MVMLKRIKQAHGAFSIWLNRMIQGIRAAFQSRGIKQRIQQDASTSMKQDLLDKMNSRDAFKPDIQAHIQSFLQTPEGQKMKAEASLRVANTYLQQILKQSNHPDLTTIVVKPSANGNITGTRKKRGDSELDNAIQRQRDFLNGFIKKD